MLLAPIITSHIRVLQNKAEVTSHSPTTKYKFPVNRQKQEKMLFRGY